MPAPLEAVSNCSTKALPSHEGRASPFKYEKYLDNPKFLL